MRVALTGATGFTGRFVTDALERAGATAVPLQVDLTDPEATDLAVQAADFDHVIHLAAHAFIQAADWHYFYTVNQIGTFHLLDAVARKKEGARCIVSSSAQVYGPNAQGLISEEETPSPANHYAVGKYAMEIGSKLWSDKLNIIITRPFNYTGIGQDNKYLVPKIVDHFRRRAPVIELGNTWVRRDFGDVRSVAEAYAGLIIAPDTPPPIVNIATGSVSSIGDIIDTLTDISGHHIDVEVNPAFVRKGDVEVLGGDVSLLRQTLPGWRPHAIDDTLQWLYQTKD